VTVDEPELAREAASVHQTLLSCDR
jgi:hypothetical protein